VRVKSPDVEVAFGPYHKETRALMDSIQTSEVEIAAIHDIDSASFDYEMIEDSDIVHTSVSNDNHGGNTAPQIQEGMQLVTAPFLLRNSAHGNRERHKSIVVESRAQTV